MQARDVILSQYHDQQVGHFALLLWDTAISVLVPERLPTGVVVHNIMSTIPTHPLFSAQGVGEGLIPLIDLLTTYGKEAAITPKDNQSALINLGVTIAISMQVHVLQRLNPKASVAEFVLKITGAHV